MLQPHGSDAVAHHAANTAAVIMPIGAIVFHLPEVLTCLLTIAGLLWYGVLFYDRFVKGRHVSSKDATP